ncbi:MAG: hypothetical protein IJ545_00155 [Alphaproteobacteria bacterium]|nr:hypothetical protein [Alphaproteobacteria bacterium]
MKQLSLWTTAIVSALFVLMVCVDQQNWELLGEYAAIIAAWMILGWYWLNRKTFTSDVRLLLNCSSPMKCQWVGTFVFLAFIVLVAIIILIWLAYLFSAWLLSLV